MNITRRKKLGKLLSFLLAFALVFAPMVSTVAAAEATFPDVQEEFWAYEYIEELHAADIIDGFEDGTFGPYKTLNRSQVAQMLTRALGLQVDPEASPSFPDVPAGHHYAPYIAAVEDAGIFAGKPDGTFGMYDDISRRQIAIVMVRAFELTMGEGDVNFTDSFFDPDTEATEAVEILASLGIITGYEDGTLFMPYNETNRAQFAKILSMSMSVSVVEAAATIEATIAEGSDYTLPAEVEVSLVGVTNPVMLPVVWDDVLNSDELGEHTFVGTLILPVAYTNPNGVTATATITVVTDLELAILEARAELEEAEDALLRLQIIDSTHGNVDPYEMLMAEARVEAAQEALDELLEQQAAAFTKAFNDALNAINEAEAAVEYAVEALAEAEDDLETAEWMYAAHGQSYYMDVMMAEAAVEDATETLEAAEADLDGLKEEHSEFMLASAFAFVEAAEDDPSDVWAGALAQLAINALPDDHVAKADLQARLDAVTSVAV